MHFLPIRASETTLRGALAMQVVLLFVWSTASIVTGFGKYDAPAPQGFNAISHLGFWLGIEIVVVTLGAMFIPCDLSGAKDQVLRNLRRADRLMTFWMVLLGVAIAANIVHLVACGVELSVCESTLCLMNSGFLIGLVVWLAIILFIEVVTFYSTYIYKRRLRYASAQLKIKKRT